MAFIILEPRIGGIEVDKVCIRIGKSDAASFRDGIQILWNMDEINLQTLYVQKYFNT